MTLLVVLYTNVHSGWTSGKIEGLEQRQREKEKKKETKTEFQTGNLSNPQSCENDWGGKEGKDGERGVRKKANFKLI